MSLPGINLMDLPYDNRRAKMIRKRSQRAMQMTLDEITLERRELLRAGLRHDLHRDERRARR